MSKQFSQAILSANDVCTGEVVFWTANESWSRNFDEAIAWTDAVLAEQALADARADQLKVVGAELVSVSVLHGDGLSGVASHVPVQPNELRERMRVNGPSIRYGHDVEETNESISVF